MKKRVFCAVTNDLNYDQRMIRICTSLTKAGFLVTLVGRENQGSLPLDNRPYRQHRLKMWTRRGKLFYLEIINGFIRTPPADEPLAISA